MGEPERGHARSPPPEHIGRGAATRGTETSKYPEEEKSTEIARVAASESAPAQTEDSICPGGFAASGLRGARGGPPRVPAESQRERVAERPGKAGRSG